MIGKIIISGRYKVCEISSDNPRWKEDSKLIKAAPVMLRVLQSLPIDDIEKISSETAADIRKAIREAT